MSDGWDGLVILYRCDTKSIAPELISRSTPEFRELFHHLLDPLSALLPKLSADHIPLSVQVVDCLAEDDRTPVMTMIKQ